MKGGKMEEENKIEEAKPAEKTITIKKSDIWKYSTFVMIAVVVVFGIFAFSGKGTGTGGVVQEPNGQPSVVKASLDDDAMIGNPNAKVTIIEFSDYQCPFCRKFWGETYQQIKTQYIDTGKVNLVFRDFPLTSLHPMAVVSGEAAECARDVGGSDEAYFKMHDKMFAAQNVLDTGSEAGPVTKTVTYTTTDFKNWAKEIGYDISSCLDAGTYKSEVLKDLADAQTSGGQGTPYFVINGNPISGAQPFAAFQQVIESELA